MDKDNETRKVQLYQLTTTIDENRLEFGKALSSTRKKNDGFYIILDWLSLVSIFDYTRYIHLTLHLRIKTYFDPCNIILIRKIAILWKPIKTTLTRTNKAAKFCEVGSMTFP